MFIFSVVSLENPDCPWVFFDEDQEQVIKTGIEVVYEDAKNDLEEYQRDVLSNLYQNQYSEDFDLETSLNILEDCGFRFTLVDTAES